MKILALDQATKTGLCRVFVDDSGKAHYETDVLYPPVDKRDGDDRLEWYDLAVSEELIRGVKLLVLEGYSYGSMGGFASHRNPETQMELGGVIKLAAKKRRVQRLIVSPQAIKKWALGDGWNSLFPELKGEKKRKAMKAAIVDAVNEELGLSLLYSQDDQADAAVLAMIGYHYVAETPLLPRHRDEVLMTLRGKKWTRKKTSSMKAKTQPSLLDAAA
jgi:hypothetical protein